VLRYIKRLRDSLAKKSGQASDKRKLPTLSVCRRQLGVVETRLERMELTNERMRQRLKQLQFDQMPDPQGRPEGIIAPKTVSILYLGGYDHLTQTTIASILLEALYEHWRPHAGRQREDQFSDGTIRLIGLLWTLLEGDALLLLEEPELSLHAEIVRKLPTLIWRLQQARGRQAIVSSHSAELFGDRGIRPDEVAMLRPLGSEGTVVELASSKKEIAALLEGGMSIAEAVLPMTAPKNAQQLLLFQ